MSKQPDQNEKQILLHQTRTELAPLQQMEEELRETNKTLQTLIQAAPLAIMVLNPDGTVKMWNPAAERIFGWSEQEVLGRPNPIVPEGHWEDFLALLQTVIQGQTVSGAEVRRRRKDGSLIDVSLSSAAWHDTHTHITHTVSVAADITERKRAEERLAAIYGLGQELMLSRDTMKIAQSVVEAVKHVLGIPLCGLLLVDEKQRALVRWTHTAGAGAPEVPAIPLDGEQGITVAVVRSGEPIYLPDVHQDPRYIPGPFPAGSELCVPLKISGKVIGVLNAESGQLDAFGPADRQLMSTLASVAAVALENARLLTETERRAHEFAALYETTRDLATQRDLSPLLQTIADRAAALLGASTGFIYLYDAAQGDLVFTVAKDSLLPYGTRLQLGEGLAGQVAQSRQPLIVDDYRAWEHRSPKLEGMPFSAVLEVPMLCGGELIGVLGVREEGETERKFTEADTRLLTLFAGQAASAVYNARWHQASERQVKRMAVLNEVGRAINSTIEMDALLELIYQQLSKIIPTDTYYVDIYDPAEEALDVRVLIDDGQRFPSQRIPLGHGLASLVIRQRRPLLCRQLSKEQATLPVTPIVLGQGRASESWLGVPMMVSDHLMGLLAVASYQPNAFTEDDVALLTNVAGQAALALDNAYHHAQVEEQARRDSLTGVYNHGHFLQRLTELVEAGREEKTPVSLIMLDIDYFKNYNDTYGHVLGDEVLRLTVQAIQAHVKKTDLVGRWGGEEFGIVLPGAFGEQAQEVAKRIRETLATLPLVDGAGRPIPKPTVSQGIATLPDHAATAADLVDVADRALYQAKSQGRDQIVVVGQ